MTEMFVVIFSKDTIPTDDDDSQDCVLDKVIIKCFTF